MRYWADGKAKESDRDRRIFDFFAAQRDRFIGYVQKRVRSIDDMDAEDIVEEVMLSIFDRADVLGQVENLAAYVYRSIHNQIIDFQRQNLRTVSLQSLVDEDDETLLIELLSDSSASVNSEVERREFMSRLGEAIDRLEPRQRAIFIATEVEGRAFRELSEEWREPIGTLLSRKSRSVKALQEMLRDLQT